MIIHNNDSATSCPACGSAEIAKYGDLKYARPLSYSTTPVELTEQPELWFCRQCESGFTQNRVCESDSIHLYTISNAGDRWQTKPFEQEKPRKVVREFRKHIKAGMRVMDIGANTGEFLDFAVRCGAKTAAIEYSAESKEILRKKGHEVFEGFDAVTGQMDVITAFDLIEHVYHIPDFFAACHKLLKPGGQLILFTGNIRCSAFRKAGVNWWYLNFPEHIVFLSDKYLRSLGSYELVGEVPCFNSRYFIQLNFSRAALFNYPKALGLRKGSAPYDGLPSPFPDHVTWVLRKK